MRPAARRHPLRGGLGAHRRGDRARRRPARAHAPPAGSPTARRSWSPATGAYGCSFAVELAQDWTTTHAIVTTFDRSGARAVELRRDDTNHWWRDGERATELDGCRDVDVAAAPFTNTFTLNRLRELPVGERWTAPFAYVEVPSLRVHRVEQTYTRLPDPTDDPDAVAAWQYHDESYGPFLVTTDAHGLVLDYEGLARRIRN